jgi:hypothetical protein
MQAASMQDMHMVEKRNHGASKSPVPRPLGILLWEISPSLIAKVCRYYYTFAASFSNRFATLRNGLQFSLIQLQSYVQIDIAQNASNSSTRDIIKALPFRAENHRGLFLDTLI